MEVLFIDSTPLGYFSFTSKKTEISKVVEPSFISLWQPTQLQNNLTVFRWHLPSSWSFPANVLFVSFNPTSKTRLYMSKVLKAIFYLRKNGLLSFWAVFALFHSVFVKVKFYDETICWTETEMASEYINGTVLSTKARGIS